MFEFNLVDRYDRSAVQQRTEDDEDEKKMCVVHRETLGL